jgi:hypothetical protein
VFTATVGVLALVAALASLDFRAREAQIDSEITLRLE